MVFFFLSSSPSLFPFLFLSLTIPLHIKVGVVVAPNVRSHVMANFRDFMSTYVQLSGDTVQNVLALQRVGVLCCVYIYMCVHAYVVLCCVCCIVCTCVLCVCVCVCV